MLRTTLASLAGAVALCTFAPAHAVGRLVDVQVVDRSTGEALTPTFHKGEWWIAGRPGARYGVTLVARTAQRTLGVVSVDGVNAISGDTAAWDQTGYVLGAYERTQIDGWRKNMNQVAAFEFTALPDSYAARTGRPANVGVIGVAIFAERRPVPILRREIAPVEDRASPGAAEPARPAPSSSSSPSSSGDAPPAQATPSMPKAERFGEASADRSRIGTGHGAIEASSIDYVSFQRAQSAPNEIVTIHYDRAENLVAMGIMPLPVATDRANPFPNSGRFVADPPPR